MSDGLLVALFFASIVGSAFFSASETALTSISDATVFRLKERHHPQAERLERLRSDLPRTLGTLLIGNTLVNIAAGSIGTALAIGALGEKWGVLAATAGTTVLLLLLGEATPKTLAARRAESVAAIVARPVSLLARWLSPLTHLLSAFAGAVLVPLGAGKAVRPGTTDEDVRSLIALSHAQGSLEREEKEILHAVLDFGDTPIRDAMVPRARMISLPASSGFPAVEEVCRAHKYSRFPVFRESPDDIVGVLHVKDLFDVSDAEEGAFDLARHLRPAVFVPELKGARDLFREMRRRRFHLAIVVDERGSVSGLVTLEDLVEQVLGDISDEHDEPAAVPVKDGSSILVEGSYPVAALERDLGLALHAEGAETVAGFLLRRFGRIPRPGARIREEDREFIVERASPRAILRVRITRAAPPAGSPASPHGPEPGPSR